MEEWCLFETERRDESDGMESFSLMLVQKVPLITLVSYDCGTSADRLVGHALPEHMSTFQRTGRGGKKA